MPLPSRLPSKNATHKVGEYNLQNKFAGYNARKDRTTLDANIMVAPSKNVLVGTSGRLKNVPGYVLDGSTSTQIDSGILSNYDFNPSYGPVRNLRAGFLTSNGDDGRLQYRYKDTNDVINWIDLKTGMSSIRLSFAEFYDTTEIKKQLLWVDGSNNVFEWNGAVTTFASASNSTGYISLLNATPTNGGTGYKVGDVVTITGGTATAVVSSVSGANSGAIVNFTISTPGTSYSVGDILNISGGTAGQIKVTAVNSSGGIISASVYTGGSGYSNYYKSCSGGTGFNAEILISEIGGQAVTGVLLKTTDSGYTTGSGKATTGGTGTGLTLDITTVSSNSVTKQGTNTWIQDGFNTSSNLKVTINNVDYTYTAIIGNKMVGINVDPTVPGFTAGQVIHQTPAIFPLANMTNPDTNFPTFGPTVIGCGRKNQLYIGSSNSNILYISKQNNFTDYSYSSPARKIGEGAFIVLNDPPTKFIPQEVHANDTAYDMYISEGRDQWAVVRSTLSSDNQYELLEHIVLKVSQLQGCQSERFACKMKNHIMFLGYDAVAGFMGYMSYEYVPVITDFSYPIINDMKSYDFTDGSFFYYQNYAYLAVPREGLIRIYNMTDQSEEQYSNYNPVEQLNNQQPFFWEAPIHYPISGFYVTEDGTLCGHGYYTSESYVLFTGGSFNGMDIAANATFAYNDYGDRTQSKGSNEVWVEGYIKQNTNLDVTITGDLDAFAISQTKTINGNNPKYVGFGSGGGALGKNKLGSNPLGGTQTVIQNVNTDSSLPAWFHVSKTYLQTPFYLEQISFDTNGVDLQWELLDFGTNATFTTEGNNAITE